MGIRFSPSQLYNPGQGRRRSEMMVVVGQGLTLVKGWRWSMASGVEQGGRIGPTMRWRAKQGRQSRASRGWLKEKPKMGGNEQMASVWWWSTGRRCRAVNEPATSHRRKTENRERKEESKVAGQEVWGLCGQRLGGCPAGDCSGQGPWRVSRCSTGAAGRGVEGTGVREEEAVGREEGE
uniref:Uncharacterized protein n=2 Tax=Opuntia streptacantha TaxID=393608 RepID=A0A7C8YCL1_OPUST